MEKLPPRRYEDIVDAFTDLLGNALSAALNWKFTGDLEQVRRMSGVFYERIEKFKGLGLPSQGGITPEAVAIFEQFREVDWIEEGRLDTIVSYYHTIIRPISK